MNIEEVRDYCLSLPRATEDMPYGDNVVVFRIEGKIFLHIWLDAPIPTIAIKLLPERNEELRESFNAINPAWHLNKRHWSDIFINPPMPTEYVKGWIHESYSLVLAGLPKKIQEQYQNIKS